ncbi:Hypothetical predicted protein, partial [Marmota monax]
GKLNAPRQHEFSLHYLWQSQQHQRPLQWQRLRHPHHLQGHISMKNLETAQC